jgi:acetyl-CoA acetyltransferase
MAASIVGVAECGLGVTGRSSLDLLSEASLAALDEAGLTLNDVDGLATSGWLPKFGATSVAEYLGIQPRWFASSMEGGATFEQFIGDAAAAIEAGYAETVLICYGSNQRSAGSRSLSSAIEEPSAPLTVFDLPFAPLLPISMYALAARRHMYDQGTTPEQLAAVAVAASRWAQLNPAAYHHGRGETTVEAVLASPMISSPLHRSDCCLVTDGAAAVVVTTAERARDLRTRPIAILGSGAAATHRSLAQAPSDIRAGAAASAAAALGQARLRATEIDVVEIYDSFTITVLLSLEGLGLCAPGEGGPLAAEGALGPGGRRPINTNGGGLAHGHPGMYGLFLVVEAARQLRLEAGARQVSPARTALCHGTGGYLNTHATVVLGTAA